MTRDGIVLGRQFDVSTVTQAGAAGDDVQICAADANRISILFCGGNQVAAPDGRNWIVWTRDEGEQVNVGLLNAWNPNMLLTVDTVGNLVFREFWASNNTTGDAQIHAVIVRQTVELPPCQS